MKKIVVYYCFLGAFAVMSATFVERGTAAEPFFHKVLPAGTRMVIPPDVLKEYQADATMWGRPFNYLSHKYAIAGPSTKREVQDTYYVPLVLEDWERFGLVGTIVMMDLMNLRIIRNENEEFFITDSITYILKFESEGESTLISVSDIHLAINIFADDQSTRR